MLRGLPRDKEPLHGKAYTGVHCYNQTKVEPQPVSNEQNTLGSNAATKEKLSRNQHASTPLVPANPPRSDPIFLFLSQRPARLLLCCRSVPVQLLGSPTTKSTQRAYACRQQGLTQDNIMCSNNNSSTSTNNSNSREIWWCREIIWNHLKGSWFKKNRSL